MLAQMAQMVRNHQPDAFVISGDVYDTTVPSASTQKMLTDALVEMHQANPTMKIFCIAGNHDSGAKHMIFSNAWKALNVQMVGNIYNDSPLEDYIFKLDGIGYFVTVPFAADRFMPDHVYTRLYDLVQEKNDENLPVILLAHTAVGCCDSTGHDLADDNQVGGINRLKLEELGTGYDYVALGHIHKQQQLDSDGKVWYCGTPLAVSFDEAIPGNDHGLLLVQCGAHGNEVKVEHLHIDNKKPLVSIPTTGFGKWDDVLDEFRQYPDDIPAYIRLNVEVKDYLTSGANDMARAVADGKKCTFCKINAQRVQENTTASGSKSYTTSELKKKDPVEVAQMWFKEVKGWDGLDERIKDVVSKAKEEIQASKNKE